MGKWKKRRKQSPLCSSIQALDNACTTIWELSFCQVSYLLPPTGGKTKLYLEIKWDLIARRTAGGRREIRQGWDRVRSCGTSRWEPWISRLTFGCISWVLWECGCWELNVRGQQHTTLRAQCRASWRCERVIWEEGAVRHRKLMKHILTGRAGLFDFSSHWKHNKPSGPQRKPMRNATKCRHVISVLCHTQKVVLGLDWCKSSLWTCLECWQH